MSKKWQKVDPATLKVGDEVRWIVEITGGRVIREVAVREIAPDGIRLGLAWAGRNMGTFYVRKPKKAKPDSELADGHTAHYWRNRYNKQLDHNKQLEASNAGRKVKMQRLEKEAKDARRLVQEWESRYAVLAASINELPEEPTPPTRPDEPPVGAFFRVDRLPLATYRRIDSSICGYFCVSGPFGWLNWDEITEPGDTITMLELREVGK